MSTHFLYRVSSSIDTSNKWPHLPWLELTPCTDDKFARDQADVLAALASSRGYMEPAHASRNLCEDDHRHQTA